MTGDLTGFGWSENVGWIKFGTAYSTVNLNHATMKIDGYVWSENAGWIHFRSVGPVAYGVATTTLPVEMQTFTVE